MKVKKQIVVFDTADLEAESSFWAALLGGEAETEVVKEDDWHTLRVGGEPRMGFQLAPNHVRPEWPDGQPQQLHLDLYVDDIAAADAHARQVGAELLKAEYELDAQEGFRVYADPAGHPFCLCW
ncbi:VOC family protein [Gryllotalpicola ginsengisoli]|uniref:VOC family protein n=1 Tax=Gryllotalpicola ginsengisoli TaxID=444608 RepID=UPI0003B583FA|nr:VOC family protein [Gryllotalpicola ginsengisoli]